MLEYLRVDLCGNQKYNLVADENFEELENVRSYS
jgi:hypothetical protein